MAGAGGEAIERALAKPLHRPLLFSAQHYPLFTPGYEDDQPVAAYQQIVSSWKAGQDTRINFGLVNPSLHSHDSKYGAKILQTSPANSNDHFKSRTTNNSLSSFNTLLTPQPHNNTFHSSPPSQPKGKGLVSWLFPRLKKKPSPNTTESDQLSQDLGNLSIETLQKELVEANENRDAALMEVSEMKSSFGELRQKLECLESYCEELKKALGVAKEFRVHEKFDNNPPMRSDGSVVGNVVMPVSEQVMVEGFLQIVSEARLSVKQFCKTLISQIEESDEALARNLNQLLHPFRLPLSSKHSKAVLYHFEAFVSGCLYQDFENCVFQKNGCPKFLDPHQDRQAHFSSFVALRNLSWHEVLRKGTKHYREGLSRFCDQKKSCIMTCLNWCREWSEELLQAFFVAAKCIWLLHLLAHSFDPAVGILRVEENKSFDGHYMEDMGGQKQRSQGPRRVKMMVMPGFYVGDRVLRCKVLCRYRSST